MLTLIELYKLLEQNELLTQVETQNDSKDIRRLLELSLHRSIIKDCIIELLERKAVLKRVA